MIRYRWHFDGDQFGMIYEMEQGSALPTHAHEDDHLHDINVLVGEVMLSHPEGDRLGRVGDRITFDGRQPHSIRALTHSVIRNMFTNGMPESYKSLPDSEHTGVIL